MRLMTKNNWLLTEHTSKLLLEQFDGTKKELVEYVANNNIEHTMFSKIKDDRHEYWVIKPRIFIGDYELYPNDEGVIATGK